MCHHEDYDHNVALVESGNWGDGICCRNYAKDGICAEKEDSDFHCSPPSVHDEENDAEYSYVISENNRNYQLFAFCPGVDQHRCGISDK